MATDADASGEPKSGSVLPRAAARLFEQIDALQHGESDVQASILPCLCP